MKLNLGCGHNKVAGFVNVDLFDQCKPDVVCDLEQIPWPWPDNSVDEVRFIHSLEHLGQNTRVFLGMIKELYRVCTHGAMIKIDVPHPRHDNFINDPTHVRAITPELLALFDRQQNDKWKAIGGSNSPFAHYLGVDFVVKNYVLILDEPYLTQYMQKLISNDEIERICRERNNVASEYRISVMVRKP